MTSKVVELKPKLPFETLGWRIETMDTKVSFSVDMGNPPGCDARCGEELFAHVLGEIRDAMRRARERASK